MQSMRSGAPAANSITAPNNKAHQYAPSVPDGKTAARFRRRCAVRYEADE